MVYAIAAAILLFAGALAAFLVHLDSVERKADQAETACFRAMSAAEREAELVKAKQLRAGARQNLACIQRLWGSYRWGYRHNPYNFSYAAARGRYEGACARVQKLEAVINELDGPCR